MGPFVKVKSDRGASKCTEKFQSQATGMADSQVMTCQDEDDEEDDRPPWTDPPPLISAHSEESIRIMKRRRREAAENGEISAATLLYWKENGWLDDKINPWDKKNFGEESIKMQVDTCLARLKNDDLEKDEEELQATELDAEMKGCVEDPMKKMANEEDRQKVVEKRSGDVDRQAEEEGVEGKKNEEAGQDLNQNSQECSILPADQSDSPSPCLKPGWGSLLPPARHQKKASVQWRPWMEERGKEVDKDLNQNSQECPPPSAFDPIPTILITPKQHGSSGSSINTKTVLPPPNMIRRAKKRRRSPGDLAKRRKRKFDFLSSQRTPYYPPYTEPEKSRLELERRDCGPWARRLDWSTTELPEEKQDRSNLRGSEAGTGFMGRPPGSRGRSGRFLSTASKTCMVSHH